MFYNLEILNLRYPVISTILYILLEFNKQDLGSLTHQEDRSMYFFIFQYFFTSTFIIVDHITNFKNLRGKSIKSCISRTSCMLIFTIGLWFATMSIFLAAALQPLSVLGADFCTPSPSWNIQRLIADAYEQPQLNTDRNRVEPLCAPLEDSPYWEKYPKKGCLSR